MRAHRTVAFAATQDAAENPLKGRTTSAPAGHTRSPANNLILHAVIEFSVDQRLVTPVAEGEAVDHQPSVGVICENREHLTCGPRISASRDPAQRIRA